MFNIFDLKIEQFTLQYVKYTLHFDKKQTCRLFCLLLSYSLMKLSFVCYWMV